MSTRFRTYKEDLQYLLDVTNSNIQRTSEKYEITIKAITMWQKQLDEDTISYNSYNNDPKISNDPEVSDIVKHLFNSTNGFDKKSEDDEYTKLKSEIDMNNVALDKFSKEASELKDELDKLNAYKITLTNKINAAP